MSKGKFWYAEGETPNCPLAFSNRNERDAWVDLQNKKNLSWKEARNMTKWSKDGKGIRGKFVPIFGTDESLCLVEASYN